jgi:hypothetical protein
MILPLFGYQVDHLSYIEYSDVCSRVEHQICYFNKAVSYNFPGENVVLGLLFAFLIWAQRRHSNPWAGGIEYEAVK